MSDAPDRIWIVDQPTNTTGPFTEGDREWSIVPRHDTDVEYVRVALVVAVFGRPLGE